MASTVNGPRGNSDNNKPGRGASSRSSTDTEAGDTEDVVHIIRPGTKVLIGEEVPGRIYEVVIRSGGHVRYEVEWWDGRNRKLEYFDGDFLKVVPSEVKPLRVGFDHAREVRN